MELTIADLFEAVADAVPGRPALAGGGVRLTYADLEARANRVAHLLLDRGVGPGAWVGVLSRNRVEWLEVMLGCFKVRAVPVNLNHRYVVPELRYVAENADLVGVVHEAAFGELVAESVAGLPAAGLRLVLDDGSPSATGGGAEPYEAALSGVGATRSGLPARTGDDLYVLYTGGTTGMPKGVLWRQEDLYLGPLGGTARRGGPVRTPADVVARLEEDDRRQVTLVVPPLMHGTGQWTSLSPLVSGGSVVLSTDHHFSAEAVWDTVEAEGITLLVMVGDVMGRPLVDALAAGPSRWELSSLRAVLTSGAPLTDPVRDGLTAHLPGVRILNRLGSSESGTMGVAPGRTDDPAGRAPGRFRGSEDTAVLDEDLRPLAPGDGRTGRLARRGHVPLGYHKDPEKTAATFVTDADGVRWVIPGDFATVLDDGTIALLGRGATTINSGGEKIYPQEVEAALATHPSVAQAIVVGVPDERFGEQVAAVVEPRAGHRPTLEELADHCRGHVAGYKVPRRLVLVDRLPLTAAGKPDHRAARELLAAGS